MNIDSSEAYSSSDPTNTDGVNPVQLTDFANTDGVNPVQLTDFVCTHDVNPVQLTDVLNLDEIQHLQDLFATACGVASVITQPDGTLLTTPSNFCRFCNIICSTEKGAAHCCESDITIGKHSISGPILQPCLSGGLWDAGASITLEGKHIATWLVGQVRNEELDCQKMLEYSAEIGMDNEVFIAALNEVPVMTTVQFEKVVNMLFEFANQLSVKAYSNLQLKEQIAERERANMLLLESKEELRLSELKYRMIAENTSDGIMYMDANRQILYASPVYLKQLGLSEEEMLKCNVDVFYKCIHPDDRDALFAKIQESIRLKKTGLIYTYRVKHAKGHYIWVEDNTKFNYDQVSNYNGSYVICRDITERKESEKQLQLLSKAVEQSPITIVITDKEGNIEYANRKFTETSGYSIEEAKGQTPRILKSGTQSQAFYTTLWGTITSGKDWHGEFRNKKKNGDLYWESAVISPIVNRNGKVTYFIAVKEDITEKKRMFEELILAKHKAEESDNLKTAFLNNISHEIRTPFNGILGFLELIQDGELTVDERDEYFNIINKSADRLMVTINDIVEISQIQTRQIALNIVETNVCDLVEKLTELSKPKAEDNGLSFILKYAFNEIDCCIKTDGTKLEAVLIRLISNAIKFTKKGFVVLCLEAKNDMLEFSVRDTGVGVAKDKHQAIFDRFMQADVSSVKQFDGSGLGLSIAKSYVEMLGGEIWVESEEGMGAAFFFTIPLTL